MPILDRAHRNRSMFAFLLSLTIPGTILAQPADPSKPRELAISPAALPSPIFRYRLVPMSSELNPGDAAPIYMRLNYEFEAAFKEAQTKVDPWLEMPLEKLPIKEARNWDMRGRIKLIELGTRRVFCDWSYPLEEQKLEAFDILLPEVQSMKTWGRLIGLKARLDLAEHRYDEAIQTIETGLAFGRHVGEGSFLINALVGRTICYGMIDRLEELVGQPGAPNLYWALTALPRPLVSMRKALELEWRLPESMIPELKQLDSPQSPAEWSSLLTRLYARIQNLGRKLVPEPDAATKAILERPLAEFKREAISRYRAELMARFKLAPEPVKAMSDDEVLCRGLVAQCHVLQDQVFKAIYVPYPEAAQVSRAAEQSIKESQGGAAHGAHHHAAGPSCRHWPPNAGWIDASPRSASSRRSGITRRLTRASFPSRLANSPSSPSRTTPPPASLSNTT